MNHPTFDPHYQPRLPAASALRLLLTALLFAAGGAHAACPSTPPTVLTPVCDGSADDTAALQSMIHAASLNGAPALIPATPNGCRVTAPLEICSNTTVLQRGLLRAKTSWSAASAAFGLYTIADGATNVRVEGGGIVDGANVAGTSGIVSGGATLGDYPVAPAFNASLVVVHGMTLRNMQQWSLRLDGVDNLRVDGVTARTSNYGVEVGHGTRHATLTGLLVSGSAGSCVKFYRGVSDSTLTSSIVSNCGAAGISVRGDQPGGYPAAVASSDITLDGNIVREALVGIEISSNASAVAKNINISASQLHHNRTTGISLLACDNCQITSNMTHHNGAAASAYQPGIFVSNSRNVKVNANTVYNEGQGTATGLGIVVMDANPSLPASARINVTGNLIYDDQTPKTMTAALGGSLPVPVVSTGNSLSSGLLDAFTYASGSVQRNYLTP